MFSKISYLHQPLNIGYSRSPFVRTDQTDWHTGYLFLAKFVADNRTMGSLRWSLLYK